MANPKPATWAPVEVAKYMAMFSQARALFVGDFRALRPMIEAFMQACAEQGLGAVYKPAVGRIDVSNGSKAFLVPMNRPPGSLLGLRYDVAWARGELTPTLHDSISLGLKMDIPSRFIWED